jgi:hypothetical protein
VPGPRPAQAPRPAPSSRPAQAPRPAPSSRPAQAPPPASVPRPAPAPRPDVPAAGRWPLASRHPLRPAAGPRETVTVDGCVLTPDGVAAEPAPVAEARL